MPAISTLKCKYLTFLDVDETKDFIKRFDCPECKMEQLNTKDTNYYLVIGAYGDCGTETMIAFKFLDEEQLRALYEDKTLTTPHLKCIREFKSRSVAHLMQLLESFLPEIEEDEEVLGAAETLPMQVNITTD